MYFDPLKAERNEQGVTTRGDGKHFPFNRGPEERVLPENQTGFCRGKVCLLQLYNSGANETDTYMFLKIKMHWDETGLVGLFLRATTRIKAQSWRTLFIVHNQQILKFPYGAGFRGSVSNTGYGWSAQSPMELQCRVWMPVF